MNSVGSINLSHFIVTIISLGTFFFIGSFIPIEALKKEGPLLKDYDNLKKLVDDIKNGDLIDDKISLNDFKGSGAYQTADKNIQNCINLAAKIGHNLKDDEIVHCFDDANYFKDKYPNVSAPQNKVPQRESEPEQNVTQANVTQKVPEPETELKQSVPETNASLNAPETNASLNAPETNASLNAPETNASLNAPETNASLNAPETNASLNAPETNASLNAPETNASLNAPETNASLNAPETNASLNAPETNASLNAPETNASLNAPETNASLNAPETNASLNAPETNASLNAPETNASLNAPETNASLNAPETNASLNAPETNASQVSKGKIALNVTVAKDPITPGESQVVTAVASDPVSGKTLDHVFIKLTIKDPIGIILKNYTATEGSVTRSFQIGYNAVGKFTILATASQAGIESKKSLPFQVQ